MLGVLEKADDFLQFLLGFVDTGDVVEGHLGVGLDVDFGLALADGEEAATQAALARHAPGEKHPDPEKDQRRRDKRQQVAKERALDDAGILDVILRQLLCQLRVHPRSHEARALVRARSLVRSLDDVIRDRNILDLAVLEVLLELAVRNGLDLGRGDIDVTQPQHAEYGEDDVPEVEPRLPFHRLSWQLTLPLRATIRACRSGVPSPCQRNLSRQPGRAGSGSPAAALPSRRRRASRGRNGAGFAS